MIDHDSFPMTPQWEECAPAIRSGDADRVNAVIDEITDMDATERAELFEDYFVGGTELYDSHADGYVRQSCVRVVEQLAPKLPAAVTGQSSAVEQPAADTVSEQSDAVCGFLLNALTDEDGRVRRSTKRALQDCVRTDDALDETATVEGLIDELAAMAVNVSGKQETHLQEAKADAEFVMQSGIGRLIQGVHEEVIETPDTCVCARAAIAFIMLQRLRLSMADEMPADVKASLRHLLAEARSYATAGDSDTAASLLESAHTVATNKLPAGTRRDRLRHGCLSAHEALPDGTLAVAYIAAMERRLPSGNRS